MGGEEGEEGEEEEPEKDPTVAVDDMQWLQGDGNLFELLVGRERASEFTASTSSSSAPEKPPMAVSSSGPIEQKSVHKDPASTALLAALRIKIEEKKRFPN